MSDDRPENAAASSVAGALLVATPLLLDPNFFRTVVYMIEHGTDGALGVVLNRPTEEPVSAHLPAWGDALSPPPVVFIGGPVANEVAVGVLRHPEFPPDEWEPTRDGIGLADLADGPERYGRVDGARVFSGYSGWVSGQLDEELRTGSWVVAGAVPRDVFTSEPETLWRRVLRRQPGRSSMYASFPDDLRSN